MPCRISHDLSLEDDTFEHSPALSFSSVILLDEDTEYADAQLREQKWPEPYLPVCFLLHCSHINAMTTSFLVAQGGFEPPLTPSGGYGFRDRCTNHYTTGHKMAAVETVPSLSLWVRARCAKAIR